MERMGIWHTDSNSVVYCISGIDFDYRKEGVKMSVKIKNVTVTFKNQVRAVDHIWENFPVSRRRNVKSVSAIIWKRQGLRITGKRKCVSFPEE